MDAVTFLDSIIKSFSDEVDVDPEQERGRLGTILSYVLPTFAPGIDAKGEICNHPM
jgi:hypothetical protein